MDSNKNEVTETKEMTFTKAQIVSSKKYINNKDVVMALLKSDKSYSFNEVDDLIKEFMKGKVK